ncbi:MAG: hypothetical protein WDM76_04865 [Limisphaerales bacterium]
MDESDCIFGENCHHNLLGALALKIFERLVSVGDADAAENNLGVVIEILRRCRWNHFICECAEATSENQNDPETVHKSRLVGGGIAKVELNFGRRFRSRCGTEIGLILKAEHRCGE